jgi:hypothetical protein
LYSFAAIPFVLPPNKPSWHNQPSEYPAPYPSTLSTHEPEKKNLLPTAKLATLLLTAGTNLTAAENSKKLLVFILAGQSNMQGHAEVSTLAYLPKPPHIPTPEEWALLTAGIDREIRLKMEPTIRENLPKDPATAKLPRNELGTLIQNALKAETDKVRAERYETFKKRQTDPARIARDKELSAIFTPNLTYQTILDIVASAKTIKTPQDLANEWEKKSAIPVGKQTYIAAYGGVNRGPETGFSTGPLSTGYGPTPTAFGPEYAFGIMMEKALDHPILIIKTAWGGKSIHYDFRPPSAGPHQPTTNEKAQLEKWNTKKALWDKYIADGGTEAIMVQLDKEIKTLENEKRKFQGTIPKLPKDQQAAAQEKVAAMNKKSQELRTKLVPPPGEMPTSDAAGFYWNEMSTFVNKVLADPKAFHPAYDPEAGFEVAIWRIKKDAARSNGDPAEILKTEQQWILHGSNLGYHYDGSGRFFIRLGDEFATSMLQLMKKK